MVSVRRLPNWLADFEAKSAPPGCSLFNPQDDAFVAYLDRKYSSSGVKTLITYLNQNARFDPSDIARMTPIYHEAYQKAFGTDETSKPTMPFEFETAESVIEGRWALELRAKTLGMVVFALNSKRIVAGLYEVPVLCLPSFELNGFALLSPQRRPSIILNFYLMFFLPLVTTTIYAASGLAHRRGEFVHWRHSSKQHSEALVRLALIAMTGNPGYLSGDATLADCPFGDGWATDSAEIIQRFVLLHEYAHISCGDLDASGHAAPVFTDIDGKQILEERINRSVLQETRADLWSCYVLSRYPNQLKPHLSVTERYSAVALFFRFLELCDQVRTQLLGLPVKSESHPPANVRLLNVIDNLNTPDIDWDLVTALLRPFDEAFDIVHSLQAAMKERLNFGSSWQEMENILSWLANH